mmetsp:Transcript_2909/g.3106  ORF Transcript_2909/g.3106 Transcript_2909/m.3106 type:complete len:88 (-) Transcript_2909:11-274(-)
MTRIELPARVPLFSTFSGFWICEGISQTCEYVFSNFSRGSLKISKYNPLFYGFFFSALVFVSNRSFLLFIVHIIKMPGKIKQQPDFS